MLQSITRRCATEIIKIPNTNGYFIRTPHGLYIYNNGKVSLLNNPDKFTFGNAHRIDDEIFVEIPVNLTKKQKNALKQFEDEGGTDQAHSPKRKNFFSKLKEAWEDINN